jgi:chemotaxis protein methyltransferase CheR
MSTGVARQLAELVREETGNIVPPERHDFLEEIAERRRRALALPSAGAYLEKLAAGDLDREWEALVSLVTIKESYFFRAPQQFEAIREHVLPRLLRARAGARRLRVWSAACARGEEPATLAMLLAGEPELAGWDWSLVATDLDAEAVELARRGIYSERAVAQVPAELLARWFSRRGKLFELSPEIRERIDYRPLNLAHPPYELPAAEYDLILLRNVLIYFRRPLQRWVVGQVAKSLARKGYLFLGASETLWQIQEDLESVDLKTCFCYRHRRTPRPKTDAAPATGTGEPAREVQKPAARQLAGHSGPAVLQPAGNSDPAARAASQASTERPSSPVDRTPPPALPRGAPEKPRPAPAPRAAASQSAPAIAPPPSIQTFQERLLAASRQLADNRVDDARKAIAGLLAEDPAEPAAHALDGFLQDFTGRPEDAASSYRAALYLEPSLFQARLLLADCLLRLGHKEKAAHQYREVLKTLEGGRERSLAALADLPLPDRERATRRCRQALGAG